MDQLGQDTKLAMADIHYRYNNTPKISWSIIEDSTINPVVS